MQTTDFPAELAHRWGGRRYYPVSLYFQEQFHGRVYKAGVESGLSCPNRDGTVSTGGCIYCDNEAFRTGGEFRTLPITDQLEHETAALRRRYRAERFLAYFQTYTNTYGTPAQLEKLYREALEFPGIVGLSVSTRPDCIDPQIADLLAQLHRERFVQVELGLQSANDTVLRTINRGHSVADFVRTARLLRERDIPVCAHIILGLPGESRTSMMESAALLNELQITGCKLHQLQIFRNTPLAEALARREISVPTLDEYLELTGEYLARLSPQITIQRLFGISNGDLVLEPRWDLPKTSMLRLFDNWLAEQDYWQSKYC